MRQNRDNIRFCLEQVGIVHSKTTTRNSRAQRFQKMKGYGMSCARCACPEYFLSNGQVQAYNAIFVEPNPTGPYWLGHNRSQGSKQE